MDAGHFVDRVDLAVKQTSDYFKRGDASTSIGLRLELWRGAWLGGVNTLC